MSLPDKILAKKLKKRELKKAKLLKEKKAKEIGDNSEDTGTIEGKFGIIEKDSITGTEVPKEESSMEEQNKSIKHKLDEDPEQQPKKKKKKKKAKESENVEAEKSEETESVVQEENVVDDLDSEKSIPKPSKKKDKSKLLDI